MVRRRMPSLSEDRGRTYHPIHDTPITDAGQSDTQHTGPGGGNTEISIDHTGKVYDSDLAALVTLKTAVWNPNANPRTLTTGFNGNTDHAVVGGRLRRSTGRGVVRDERRDAQPQLG